MGPRVTAARNHGATIAIILFSMAKAPAVLQLSWHISYRLVMAYQLASESKPLVSPSISRILLFYIIPYTIPDKEFRLAIAHIIVSFTPIVLPVFPGLSPRSLPENAAGLRMTKSKRDQPRKYQRRTDFSAA